MPAWRSDPLAAAALFEQIPRRFGRLGPADTDLANPWLAWAKSLAHRLAEVRGRGRTIRFAANRGLAVVLTGHVEADVIRHTEIFSPLRALDLSVGCRCRRSWSASTPPQPLAGFRERLPVQPGC
ncbi:hypothetical protein ACFY71_40780 [Streptomyces cinerochromogenes]|uniref:hypothetical protein n=1 Tax=Streptomyces cinerochromogenes TaxID=66422 RepID=UPI00369C5967